MSKPLNHLAAWLAHHAQSHSQTVALRHKQRGLWREWRWPQLLELSSRYAAALRSNGFSKTQRILIQSSPNIDVIAISLAVQALGGHVQLIEHSSTAAEPIRLHAAIDLIQPDYVLVEHVEQLWPFERLQHRPVFIFYIEQNAIVPLQQEYISAVHSLLKDASAQPQFEFTDIAQDDQAIAFSFHRLDTTAYQTTTYSHPQLIAEAQQLVESHQLDQRQQGFMARAFSSVGHMRYLWPTWLVAGFCLNIPETLATRDHDRRLIAPTLLVGTAATYSRLEQQLRHHLPAAESYLTRQFNRLLQAIAAQQQLTVPQKLLLSIFRTVMVEQVGLSELQTALLVGEPVSHATQVFYQLLGIRLQPWGQAVDWQDVEVPTTLGTGATAQRCSPTTFSLGVQND